MSITAQRKAEVIADNARSTAKQARGWAERGDVFAYFISGAKVRNPAAAQALIAKLGLRR